ESIAANLARGLDNRSEAFETARAELALILSVTQQQIALKKGPAEIIKPLMARLEAMRLRLHDDTWNALAPIIQSHPVLDYFLEDPLTRWS
ncbi:hypothetical protein, partial [Klebsiella variicola]